MGCHVSMEDSSTYACGFGGSCHKYVCELNRNHILVCDGLDLRKSC